MAGATAVLYDEADARRFMAERPEATHVLALTPNVRAALTDARVPIVSSRLAYGPFAHRRTLARIRRTRGAVTGAAENAGLSPASAETLRGVFEMAGSMSARAHATLGTGPWVFPMANGWRRLDDRQEACATLLFRLATLPHWQPYQRPPVAALLRGLNATAAAILPGRQTMVFCNANKGFADVIGRLREHRPGFVAVNLHPCAGGWRDLARSLRGLWQAMTRQRIVQLAVAPDSPEEKTRRNATEVFKAVSDPVLRCGIAATEKSSIDYVMDAARMVAPLTTLIARLKPAALVTYSLRWRFEAALGEAAGRAHVPCYLVSHGSHAEPQTASAAEAADGHAEGLLVSRMADLAFPQSPPADRAARRLMPELQRRPVRPAVWGHRSVAGRSAGVFRVLHAGTLKSWRDHRPWMYETSDEFVDGLVALAESFHALGPGQELVIRVRAAPECTLETLHALVPEAENVSIKSTGNFLDDLAGADLLVSHSSTTIEEALTARRPVMLFGGGCPYRHFPARTTPPTATDRDAVYAVDHPDALPAMIAAIREAHQDRLLSDDELSDYVWPPGTETLDAFLNLRLVSGEGRAAEAKQYGQTEKPHG